MFVSALNIFKIGPGPSSSHTLGPMRAAYAFLLALKKTGFFTQCYKITIDLYGSLALTGKGHGTDKAVLLGLLGEVPDTVDTDLIDSYVQAIWQHKKIALLKEHPIEFNETHLRFCSEFLPKHANGMRFTAYDKQDHVLLQQIYYSIGGGFIVSDADFGKSAKAQLSVPFPFEKASVLLSLCKTNNLSIADLMLANECAYRSKKETQRALLGIIKIMQNCIHKGMHTTGILPGGLGLRRKAHMHYQKLITESKKKPDRLDPMAWLNICAMAVNEENAAGGRIVTAPTNGAAGIIPAVLYYYMHFCGGTESGQIIFLLTAAAIALLYKHNAAISGAEMGCQGEVGVACSMAAAALTAVLGGSLAQIENAAEIGIEHNLGLPCDPPLGLVQIPCIERNAMGAVKALNAAKLALAGDGCHKVSLDVAIRTMADIGKSMNPIYKETALGGLAVNIPLC